MTVTRKEFEMELRWTLDQQQVYLDAKEIHRKRGHRHPFCFHGTNQWVDYDPICGGCEEGAPDEYSTPQEVRAWKNEWYGTNYGEDHLLWRFQRIPWGDDFVEVVHILDYEAQRIEGKMTPPIDHHNVRCILALVSDGEEFEMILGTDELILADPEEELEQDRIEEFNRVP